MKPKYLLVLAVVVIGVILALELTNTTHLFHTQKVPTVIPLKSSPSAKSTGSAATKTPSSSGQQSDSTKTPPSSGTTGLALQAPYGDFVSNHHPGGSAPLDEVSVCNTTPGASCYIKFSNGETSTQLAAQIAGADGSATWSWNVDKDAHLTKGNWQVTAVASLDGQTKSTNDQLSLVIP